MSEIIKQINVDGVDYDIVGKELTKITYAELKVLRDNGQLREGHLYRITDYVTTTTQSETKSAGHVFDVIVLAVSASELSHIARAIQHEGDTYFDGNDLGAWELWYDLDNDTSKYLWADKTNGKGVIYRMIDDKHNDCPYDFKNIQSKRSGTYSYLFGSAEDCTRFNDFVVKNNTIKPSYTMFGVRILLLSRFSNIEESSVILHNTIGSNSMVELSGSQQSNIIGDDCGNISFKKGCTSNIIGDGCKHIMLLEYCIGNHIGGTCSNCSLCAGCCANAIAMGNEYILCGEGLKEAVIGPHRRNPDEGWFVVTEDYRVYTNSIEYEEKYYDDGSGKLVPIKHPDLSTQPSILPYKFMGQYVYEQLIPIKRTLEELNNSYIEIDVNEINDTTIFAQPNNGVIEANFIIFARYNTPDGYPKPPTMSYSPVSLHTMEQYGIIQRIIVESHPYTDPTSASLIGAWLRIVYTSMPEEGGGYYGYDNY